MRPEEKPTHGQHHYHHHCHFKPAALVSSIASHKMSDSQSLDIQTLKSSAHDRDIPCEGSPCGTQSSLSQMFSSEISILILLFFSSFFVVFVTATGISLCVIWYRERGTRSALKAVRKVSNVHQERDPVRNSLRNLNNPFPNNQRYIADCESGYRINELDGKSLNEVGIGEDEFGEVSESEGSVRMRTKRCTNREKALSLTTFATAKSNSLRDVNRRSSIVSDRTLFTNSSNESPPLVTRNYRVHHILREILSIERTFSKELELICSWVRDFFESELHSSIQSDSFMRYLSLLEPLSDIHKTYLEDLEFKFATLSMSDEDEESLSFEASRFQSLTEPIISCLEVTFILFTIA